MTALFRVFSRVHETSTTEGTAAYQLLGPAPGKLPFSRYANGEIVAYMASAGNVWEQVEGVYTAAGGGSLGRSTVVLTSNGDQNKINWGSGTRDIYAIWPTNRAMLFDTDGAFTLGASFQQNYSIYGYRWFLDQDPTRVGDYVLKDERTGLEMIRINHDGAPGGIARVEIVTDLYGDQNIDCANLKIAGQQIQDGALHVVTSSSTGAPQANHIPILDANGELDRSFIPDFIGASATTFGASGLLPGAPPGAQAALMYGDGLWRYPYVRHVGPFVTGWVNGGFYVDAHGLGGYPDDYLVEFECITAEGGMTPGRRFRINAQHDESSGGNRRGCLVGADGGNLSLAIETLGIMIPDTSVGVPMTPSRWGFRFRALRYLI